MRRTNGRHCGRGRAVAGGKLIVGTISTVAKVSSCQSCIAVCMRHAAGDQWEALWEGWPVAASSVEPIMGSPVTGGKLFTLAL